METDDTVVKPKSERLYLVDVYRRAHEALLATKKATPEQLADSEARIAWAVTRERYIDVKCRLNAGEHADFMAAMSPYQTAGERAKLATASIMFAKPLAYLTGWNLTDGGVLLPMSPQKSPPPDPSGDERLATLRSLDQDDFGEVSDAIDAHIEAVEKSRAARKNGQAGAVLKSDSSPSPDVVIGPITMSAP